MVLEGAISRLIFLACKLFLLMKIIQITDLHIANEGEDTFGVDVRQNFLDVLNTAKSYAPGFVVLSGDICFNTGELHIYQWVKSQLDFAGLPYAVIGGNHDDSKMIAAVFQAGHLLTGGDLYYKRHIGNNPVLFLETSKGIVSDEQLAWLQKELSQIKHDAVIFMHHPPVIGGVPHMDINYPLQNMAAVQEVFFNFPHHISVFCGHYHVEKVLCKRNLTVHITPSTYFQMDWHAERFSVDHLRPGFREISIRPDGVVDSTVVYLEGNKIDA
ncbi:MAG: metallophosphoesterase [Saprospiraceae bacterium]|nr:MAG: metallophosphoesterase [Saprospiraceae bacterium]